MVNILTAAQMKETEKYTIEQIGISSLVLMERASMMTFYQIMRRNPKNVLIFAGTGNNGGDGIALARMLKNIAVNTKLCLIGNQAKCSSENLAQQHSYKALNGTFIDFNELKNSDNSFDIIIDALLGIGINRNLEGDYLDAVNYINASNSYIYSLDIASGINTDTGFVLGNAVKANETICFSEMKLGHVLNDGPVYSGKITSYDIGILSSDRILKSNNIIEGNSNYANLLSDSDFSSEYIHSLKLNDIANLLPKRNPNGHKGSFGKVLIIAGCAKMAGAALLASQAAFKSGAGMVKLLSDEINKLDILTILPELMYKETNNITDEELSNEINWSDIIVIGPGLSTNENAERLVKYVLKNSNMPIIVDADALNILSNNMNLLIERKNKFYTTILTPHVGEFKRLFLNENISPSDPFAISKIADKYGIILVSKNHNTIISDGSSTFINITGNSGMATAGSGDVLTGIMASLCCNMSDRLLGTALSVFMHGIAGDKAKENSNEYSMTASDIILAMGTLLSAI